MIEHVQVDRRTDERDPLGPDPARGRLRDVISAEREADRRRAPPALRQPGRRCGHLRPFVPPPRESSGPVPVTAGVDREDVELGRERLGESYNFV